MAWKQQGAVWKQKGTGKKNCMGAGEALPTVGGLGMVLIIFSALKLVIGYF